MTSRVNSRPNLTGHLLSTVDRVETNGHKRTVKAETRIQGSEDRFLVEREQRGILANRITEETNRADQLQRELAAEQQNIATLREQIEAMQQQAYTLVGELDHEKAMRGDLEIRLKAAEAHVETLNQQLSRLMRAAAVQNQLVEANRIKWDRRKEMLMVPFGLAIQAGTSSGAGWAGGVIGGPLGALIGVVTGTILSTLGVSRMNSHSRNP